MASKGSAGKLRLGVGRSTRGWMVKCRTAQGWAVDTAGRWLVQDRVKSWGSESHQGIQTGGSTVTRWAFATPDTDVLEAFALSLG